MGENVGCRIRSSTTLAHEDHSDVLLRILRIETDRSRANQISGGDVTTASQFKSRSVCMRLKIFETGGVIGGEGARTTFINGALFPVIGVE